MAISLRLGHHSHFCTWSKWQHFIMFSFVPWKGPYNDFIATLSCFISLIGKIDIMPWSIMNYRKIQKISPGAYIFQRPFSRDLFLEGLMYGEKFAFQNRLGWPYSWKEIYRFSVLPCIWGQFASTNPWGDLYLEGSFNGGFLQYEFGGLIIIWRDLYMEGLIFGILRYIFSAQQCFIATSVPGSSLTRNLHKQPTIMKSVYHLFNYH